jgi:hypothetical protein
LWDERERARQKKRTEHYREIMEMQQTANNVQDTMDDVGGDGDAIGGSVGGVYGGGGRGGGGGGGGGGGSVTGDLEKLTKLAYYQQMENYLTYGKWDLTDKNIERLKKDAEMKDRVSSDGTKFPLVHNISLPIIRGAQCIYVGQSAS